MNRQEEPQEPWKYGIPRRPMKKILQASKEVNEYSIAFILVKDPKDHDSCILVIDKINNVVMEKPKEINNAEQLPVTCLLKQWQVKVRKRSNGLIQKLYYHPSSSKAIRSLVEVSKFIRDNYKVNRDQTIKSKQIRVHKERFLRPSGENLMAQILQTFEEFLQASSNYQSSQSLSNAHLGSFNNESPEMISEMIEELLDKENDISLCCSSKDESQEMINRKIKELFDKEKMISLNAKDNGGDISLNAEVQTNIINQDIAEDETQLAEAWADKLGEDIDDKFIVDPKN